MANYPTDTYSNLEERFKSIAGLQSLETTDAAFFKQSVNRRIRTAYERYPWPEFTVVGESVTLNENSNQDGNEIQTYNVTSANGAKLANDANVVFRIHKTNPTTTRYPDEYTFVSLLDASGNPSVRIVSSATLASAVFVTYRKDLNWIIKEPTYNSETSTWTNAYTSGFFGDETGDNPNIPYTFFEYASFGAYADFLRGDGQTEKAQVEDQNAELILRSEIDKVRNQSRQFRHDILQYRPMTQFRRHNLQAGGSPINGDTNLGNNVQ